jgi:hypothetical protein
MESRFHIFILSAAERGISLWTFPPTKSRARCFAEFTLSEANGLSMAVRAALGEAAM